ncbi:hypothetical protein [Halorubrum tropicale]|uniref:hypothetical protein n=1 Tax=Halorubrum tropicale TaxID=1765655 RepID=UPI001430B150|nr:hypothetical protein [Halorubrum tropicale]
MRNAATTVTDEHLVNLELGGHTAEIRVVGGCDRIPIDLEFVPVAVEILGRRCAD